MTIMRGGAGSGVAARRRSTAAATALAGAVALAALAGCSSPASEASPGRPPARSATVIPSYPIGLTLYPVGARRPLPTLRGPSLSGGRLTTSTLTGRIVVLNVWASWCDPCRAESPALAALSRSPVGRAARFLGVDETDTTAPAVAFLHRVGVGYPQLLDPSGDLLARLSPWLPAAVPGTLVIDPQGGVAARVVGAATVAQLGPVLARLETA